MEVETTDNREVPRSRSEAKRLGIVAYFTGKVCQNGHIHKRYTNTGICYVCKRTINNRNYKNNHDTSLARSRKDYQRNREKKIVASIKWKRENPEKARIIHNRNKEKHKEKYKDAESIRVQEKIKNDPEYHAYKRMSKSIWHFLKMGGMTKGGKWIDLVGYSVEDLIQHLESQFDDKMTWDNYGSYWHIDHIVPKQYFLDHSLEDKEHLFQCCWSLENLRPLSAKDNLSKHDSTESEESKILINKFKL